MCFGKIVIEREELPLDDKWTARLWGFCDAIVDRFSSHPAFEDISKDALVSFVGAEVSSKINEHVTSRLIYQESKAGWTGYTDYLVINVSDVCADLALATLDHFILKN